MFIQRKHVVIFAKNSYVESELLSRLMKSGHVRKVSFLGFLSYLKVHPRIRHHSLIKLKWRNWFLKIATVNRKKALLEWISKYATVSSAISELITRQTNLNSKYYFIDRTKQDLIDLKIETNVKVKPIKRFVIGHPCPQSLLICSFQYVAIPYLVILTGFRTLVHFWKSP